MKRTAKNRIPEFAKRFERGLIRAGKEARRVAKMHGTPIYIMENGKIIAIKP
jgi:hypothetical protein